MTRMLHGLVYQPPGATVDEGAFSPRGEYQIDAFVAAVAGAMGVQSAVFEGTLGDAPADGFLLVFDRAALTGYESLAGRVVLINAGRATVSRLVEELGLVAAIEQQRYFLWTQDQGDGHGGGLIGRKDVAAEIGARYSAAYASASYALLSHGDAASLPTLLAIYLRAYAKRSAGSDISMVR